MLVIGVFFLEIFILMVYNAKEHKIFGPVAQLGAHYIRIVGVVGSNPIRSTKKETSFVYLTKEVFYNDIHSFLFTRKYITGQRCISYRISNISLKFHGFVI